MTMVSFIEVLKIIVFTSVLFVWVVRYDNIISEFKDYKLPAWVRDLVGILKISFVIMLLNKDSMIILLGSLGIALLMCGALFTHFRVKNPAKKMLPSLTLLIISIVIFLFTF